MFEKGMIQVAGVSDRAEAGLLVASGVRYLGFPLRLPVNVEDLSEVEAAALIADLPEGVHGQRGQTLSRNYSPPPTRYSHRKTFRGRAVTLTLLVPVEEVEPLRQCLETVLECCMEEWGWRGDEGSFRCPARQH